MRLIHRKFLGAKRGRLGQVSLRAVFLMVSLACCWSVLYAQAKPSQYQIEATYLFNFSRFVAWPPQALASKTAPFGICVLGADPFGPALDTILSGEHVGGRNLVAKRIMKVREASDCQILFVSASEQEHLKDIIATLDDSSVLTVSDIPEFSQHGGMIQFVMAGDKVRFEVNLKRASDAGLTLSADLLKVAVTVRKDPQPGA